MLTSTSREYWVTQTAWIMEPPSQEELTLRGKAIMDALGKDPRLSGVAVMTSGVTDELAEKVRVGESDDPKVTELTMSGVIVARGILDASMRGAPVFMAAFKFGAFGDHWEWSGSRVKMLVRQEVDAPS